MIAESFRLIDLLASNVCGCSLLNIITMCDKIANGATLTCGLVLGEHLSMLNMQSMRRGKYFKYIEELNEYFIYSMCHVRRFPYPLHLP